jgi:hypothetical protein
MQTLVPIGELLSDKPNNFLESSCCPKFTHCFRRDGISILLQPEPCSSAAHNHARLNTKDGTLPNPTDLSRGMYGALVGVPRLLKLFDHYNIKSTWFAPGHTIESFPDEMAKVRDAGHEL